RGRPRLYLPKPNPPSVHFALLPHHFPLPHQRRRLPSTSHGVSSRAHEPRETGPRPRWTVTAAPPPEVAGETWISRGRMLRLASTTA
ncbi:unnamed protein product, partial [Urochloa humidicola]